MGGLAALGLWLAPVLACASQVAPGPEGAQARVSGPHLPQPPEALEGRPVADVLLRRPRADVPGLYEPLSPEAEQLARNQIRVQPGTPLALDVVLEDVSRLNRLGRFRTIRSEVQPRADGSVTVIYTLSEQPLIQDVQVVGNREITDQDILAAAGVTVGTPADRFQIDRGARAIEDLYRARGFYAVRVGVDERALEASAIVLYRVIEGQRVRVTGLRFEGNRAFSDRELRARIRTAVYIPIIEKAPLDRDVLIEDAAALAAFYRDRGYLDVQVGTPEVIPSPDGREAIVVFHIAEGPLYTLRSVQVFYVTPEDVQEYRARVLGDPAAEIAYLTPEQMRQIGRRAFSPEQIAGLMALRPGDIYREDMVRKSLDRLRVAYGKLGYLLDTARGPIPVRIDPQTVRDPQQPLVDLLLFIHEGRPWRTGEVIVSGNELTRQQVILRRVRVRPERPLDATALEDTQRGLEQTRLFERGSVRVAVQPPDPQHPGRRDVLVEVAETSTGELNFGAAIGSDAGVTGMFQLRQRNFDLAALPRSLDDVLAGRAFRGAGQILDLSLQPGTQVQTYRLTLTEPYFLETDTSLSGTALYRFRDFREYDEERYGAHLALGRRFGTVWTGTLRLRNEWVDLRDIADSAPEDFFDVEDRHRISLLGLELSRNTTDDRFRPSRGNVLTFGVEQAGVLGGDFDFTKLTASGTAFLTLYESFMGYRTVLKLESRLGLIPQGQDAAPVYERFFMGGQSFRGFGFRSVSPKGIRRDTGQRGDDPVGGVWSLFLGAEVYQPVFRDIVGAVAFVDSGTVETSLGLSDYRVSVGLGLRLYVWQLSPVPLAFDFGFPLLRRDGDRERIFTFSIDVPY